MATKKKKAPAKKKEAKKEAPAKGKYSALLLAFLELDKSEVTPLALTAAHQALWGATSRSLREAKVLTEIQALRGSRRP